MWGGNPEQVWRITELKRESICSYVDKKNFKLTWRTWKSCSTCSNAPHVLRLLLEIILNGTFRQSFVFLCEIRTGFVEVLLYSWNSPTCEEGTMKPPWVVFFRGERNLYGIICCDRSAIYNLEGSKVTKNLSCHCFIPSNVVQYISVSGCDSIKVPLLSAVKKILMW